MSSSTLFTPLKVGASKLQHRIAMAPLTRFRADDNHVPLPMVPEYYAQRASVPGTLLITEATFIAPQAGGYSHAPGIWSKDQITAWKKVTNAVHAKKSYVWMQLWALGRTADPTYLEQTGYKVKSASDIPFEGGAKPEALTEAEIKEYIGLYAQAAKNAIEAGFDGVEIHGANGYLVDQFLQDTANQRTDSWGGSIENRARFGLEVAKAVVAAVGADKTAIRLSPYSPFQGMKMADPIPQFSYFVQGLKKLNLAYLHVVESRITGNEDVEATENINFVIDIWDGTSPIFIAGGFTAESAKKTVDEEYKGKDIVIVFGRYYIANPDLPFRVKEGIEFTPYDRNFFYNKTQEQGYTTYAFSKEFEAQQKAIEASA
ncbi:hypothetical protein OCU04_001745 [Sclerotinia nivalis]|uniref:NADH:flavin oxidoreductase/NADH oxidase N-terminal domain-containing protein n=1 Tax=Sclerotinia nivalis TaxID=352851 RepID=A0A9X0AZH5_9HELO|nr:hypothetical protein OCU04_001745 [Sclerotinia nivalis]